jgi:nitrous oxide reductase accessory protein NosL
MKSGKLALAVFTCMIIISFNAALFAADFIMPTEKDKCAVCGMKPYKYPKWIAEIIFNDGTYAVFDGPKDMFKFYFNMSKYNKDKAKNDIADIYVTEYYTSEYVRAGDVFFVTGSDVYGPMGMELVPVKGKKAAETFMRDHGGGKMLSLDELKAHDIPGGHKNM